MADRLIYRLYRQRIGDSIEKRANEYSALPAAAAAVKEALERQRGLAASTDAQYEHIATEERAKVTTKCVEVEAELAKMIADNGARKSFEDPAFPCVAFEKLVKVSCAELQRTQLLVDPIKISIHSQRGCQLSSPRND